MRPGRSRPYLVLVLVAVAAAAPAAGACFPTLRLAAPYDAALDQGATHLQRSMDAFLTRLEHLPSSDPARSYEDSRDFYINYGVELRALRVRAMSLQGNSVTVEQLTRMENSLEELRATHESQGRLSPRAIREFRNLFNTAWTAILAFELAKKR